MFEQLIESGPGTGPGLRPRISALAVHAGIAVAAIQLTAGIRAPVPPRISSIPVIFEAPTTPSWEPGRSSGAARAPVITGTPPAPDFPVTAPPPVDPGLPSPGWSAESSEEAARVLAGRTDGPSRQIGEFSRLDGAPTPDEVPELLEAAEPGYPAALRRAGVEGTATVEFVVDPRGAPDSATVRVISADHSAFGEAAVQAILASRFRPGRSNGVAVAVRVRELVRFRLRGR